MAACGGQSNGGGKVTFGESTPRKDTVKATGKLLNFQAPKLGGGTLDGNDFAGQDLVMWFWAPW